jgi:hypothetical protein
VPRLLAARYTANDPFRLMKSTYIVPMTNVRIPAMEAVIERGLSRGVAYVGVRCEGKGGMILGATSGGRSLTGILTVFSNSKTIGLVDFKHFPSMGLNRILIEDYY